MDLDVENIGFPCDLCSMTFKSELHLRVHQQSFHLKSLQVDIEDYDDVSTLDWIKRKRDLAWNEDESLQDFSLRIENVVLSAHHDLKRKYGRKSSDQNCSICLKRNEIECLQLFISGLDSDYQNSLELKLKQCYKPSVHKAIDLMSQLSRLIKKEKIDIADVLKNSKSSSSSPRKRKFKQEDDDDDDLDEDNEKMVRNNANKRIKHETVNIKGYNYAIIEDMPNIVKLEDDDFDRIKLDLYDQYPAPEGDDDKSELLECPLCPPDNKTRFKKNSVRIMHIFRVHKHLSRFHCTDCDLGTLTFPAIIKHVKSIHDPDKKHKCNQCDEAFLNSHILILHKATAHGENGEEKKEEEEDGSSKSNEPFMINGYVYHRLQEPMTDIAKMSDDDYDNIWNDLVAKYPHDVAKKEKSIKCNLCGDKSPSYYNNNARLTHIIRVHMKIDRARCLICKFGNPHVIKVLEHVIAVHKKARPYKCIVCASGFGTKNELTKHCQQVHSVRVLPEKAKNFKCQYCESAFESNGVLDFHILKAHSEHYELKPETTTTASDDPLTEIMKDIVNSEEFQETATTTAVTEEEEELMFHGYKYHRMEAPMTDVAVIYEEEMKRLVQHLLDKYPINWANKGQHDCPICMETNTRSQKWPKVSERNYHIMRVHMRFFKMKCLICKNLGKSYGDWGPVNMIRHIKTVHEKIKPFKCGLCEFSTGNKSSLESHDRSIHQDLPRSSVCDICGMTYKQIHHLNQHKRRVHSKEKNVMCTLCGQQYFDSNSLKKHIDSAHTKARADCPHCGVSCAKHSLKSHIQSVHIGRERIPCPHCDKTFTRNEHVKRHCLKVHQQI